MFRPLEVYPPLLDFGIIPCELSSLESADRPDYGISDIDKLNQGKLDIQAVNLSFDPQSLTLDSLSPEFSTKGRTWSVAAGEKLLIPFTFHPVKEQVQCRGEAVFTHNYGRTSIKLLGTGATADLKCDPEISFGSVKYGSVVRRKFCLLNQGRSLNNTRSSGYPLQFGAVESFQFILF